MKPSRHATGLWAEKKAEVLLMLKGYRILARRFKTPSGEIDLVAKRGSLLVFVEVKHRQSVSDAAEAVHAKNRQRVEQAAALYLQKHPEYNDLDMRFDVIIVTPGAWPQHISAAWRVDG